MICITEQLLKESSLLINHNLQIIPYIRKELILWNNTYRITDEQSQLVEERFKKFLAS